MLPDNNFKKCINYQMLCNKLPPNLVVSNNKNVFFARESETSQRLDVGRPPLLHVAPAGTARRLQTGIM